MNHKETRKNDTELMFNENISKTAVMALKVTGKQARGFGFCERIRKKPVFLALIES